MTNASDALPSDLAAAHAMIPAERAARLEAEAAAARERAANSSTDAQIGRLKLEIEKLRRELYGTRSERKARLLDQLEMQLEDLEADAIEDELRRRLQRGRQALWRSSASAPRASRSRATCRANALSPSLRRAARAAAR